MLGPDEHSRFRLMHNYLAIAEQYIHFMMIYLFLDLTLNWSQVVINFLTFIVNVGLIIICIKYSYKLL